VGRGAERPRGLLPEAGQALPAGPRALPTVHVVRHLSINTASLKDSL
jgi:hypothetical protein